MGGYNKAKDLLTTNLKQLEDLAEALLERETLDLKEITEIIDGKPPKSEDDGTPKEELSEEEILKEKKSKKKSGPLDDPDGLLVECLIHRLHRGCVLYSLKVFPSSTPDRTGIGAFFIPIEIWFRSDLCR